ncbi:hypothetical protein NC653_035531 [Populus alba x Populus x berolinensis]|uniref:Uncharacterized protein n=1 Tax=Populus alba x Populus x berolinensis TaxID=444605 RepID=A0AAD6LQR7_9ROSI|nr:hypothetical protein NC653_035531 [Populus alba x Populus x berolinensis]
MEAAKSNASDTVPKQDPPPPPQTHSSKRKLSHVDLTNSSYFKIRAAVQQLRPKVFQALQTPDFRGCKAAHELRSQSKLMMDLYNQMTTAAGLGKNVGGRQLPDRHRDGGIHQPSHISAETFTSRMKFDDGLKIRGSYVVGGSVCGWKFITWAGSGPNYYGVTKESHRDTLKKPAAGGSHCN